MVDQEIGWIAAIVIGGIAGWLAEQFMKSDMGLLMNIMLGIVGAAIASAIFFASRALVHALGQTLDEIAVELDHHGDDGQRREMRERSESPPGNVLRAVSREKSDRDRLGVGLGEEHGVEEIVPGEHDAEDGAGDQARNHSGQGDPDEGAEVRAAIGQRRLLNRGRRGAKE
jgi:uncharacterized membrane protein YeaQ/YmgE (transglycosylase-associated protein family)